MGRFDGKVALVTSSTQGLGEAPVRAADFDLSVPGAGPQPIIAVEDVP